MNFPCLLQFSRELVASVATRILAPCLDQWLRHRLWSRPCLLSVSLELMSRPRFHVVTSLSFSSPGFLVATSILGCDHLSVCRMTSCCDFLFLVAIVLVVFCLHRFQFYVATSFSTHFFSSCCNLSSLWQPISSFQPLFQVVTSSLCCYHVLLLFNRL